MNVTNPKFQNWFNTAVNGMRMQGGPCTTAHGGCYYELGGRHCAFGLLIDAEADPDLCHDMDTPDDNGNSSIGSVLMSDLADRVAENIGVDLASGEEISFLIELQQVHDQAVAIAYAEPAKGDAQGKHQPWKFMPSFEEFAAMFAKKWGIAYTPPV